MKYSFFRRYRCDLLRFTVYSQSAISYNEPILYFVFLLKIQRDIVWITREAVYTQKRQFFKYDILK